MISYQQAVLFVRLVERARKGAPRIRFRPIERRYGSHQQKSWKVSELRLIEHLVNKPRTYGEVAEAARKLGRTLNSVRLRLQVLEGKRTAHGGWKKS